MEKDEILKAIAHPTRMEILNWLKKPEEHFSTQEHPFEMGVCASQFERCGRLPVRRDREQGCIGILHDAVLIDDV